MYGHKWTAGRVMTRLVEVFRRLPNTPIYSPTLNELHPAVPGLRIDGLDLIIMTAEALGRESMMRRRILIIARCGGSIRRICREEGWPRATVYRYAGRVARYLNARSSAYSQENVVLYAESLACQ